MSGPVSIVVCRGVLTVPSCSMRGPVCGSRFHLVRRLASLRSPCACNCTCGCRYIHSVHDLCGYACCMHLVQQPPAALVVDDLTDIMQPSRWGGTADRPACQLQQACAVLHAAVGLSSQTCFCTFAWKHVMPELQRCPLQLLQQPCLCIARMHPAALAAGSDGGWRASIIVLSMCAGAWTAAREMHHCSRH